MNKNLRREVNGDGSLDRHDRDRGGDGAPNRHARRDGRTWRR
jgi:hypothetical protein